MWRNCTFAYRLCGNTWYKQVHNVRGVAETQSQVGLTWNVFHCKPISRYHCITNLYIKETFQNIPGNPAGSQHRLDFDEVYSGKFYYLLSLLLSIPSCIPNDMLQMSSSFFLLILNSSSLATYAEMPETCSFLGKQLYSCLVYNVSTCRP